MRQLGRAPRRAGLGDADRIAELVNRAYEVEAFFVSGDRTTRQDVVSHLERGDFFLLEESPSVVPLACVFVEAAGRRGYFGMLAVDPERQGEGLGRLLVKWTEEYLRRAGCERAEILVVDLRSELVAWYRSLGYEEVGTKPFPDRARMLEPCRFLVLGKRLR